MNIPEIITADSKDLKRVKGVLKLGFASDTLVRWIFPDAANYLKSFDVWMKEFSKIAFENDVVYAEKNFSPHRQHHFHRQSWKILSSTHQNSLNN